MSGALVKRLKRCSRAAVSTAAGAPPHRNAETGVLVSATTRTAGRDLRVNLSFSEHRLQVGELVHRGEELIDLPLLHGLAQQALDCFRAASEAELPSWAA